VSGSHDDDVALLVTRIALTVNSALRYVQEVTWTRFHDLGAAWTRLHAQ
jgi:hypothetical protein